MIGTLVRDAAAYQAAFETERAKTYPMVDGFETSMGFAVTIPHPEFYDAARVLACPLKVNPPNWQHGRVLYALTMRALASADGAVRLLDIGTAKGFSALCLQWALMDSEASGVVTSVDVLDPAARVSRNTVAEVDGLKTLAEILAPWPEAQRIEFLRSTGVYTLNAYSDRIHVAFVDGKHARDIVSAEATLLAARQQPGDVVFWDDVQIPGVAAAVADQSGYDVEYLEILPNRKYAIGRRR